MPLFFVILPINATVLFKGIFSIAAFDFYDMGDIIHDLLDVEASDPFNINFEELGLESRFVLNNLGTMMFFYILYFTLVLLH